VLIKPANKQAVCAVATYSQNTLFHALFQLLETYLPEDSELQSRRYGLNILQNKSKTFQTDDPFRSWQQESAGINFHFSETETQVLLCRRVDV